MVIRMLDAVASDFLMMTAAELKTSIARAEGRTVAAEVICTDQSPVAGVSHGEIAASMGADIIVLDRYDSLAPVIHGVPAAILDDPAPLLRYRELIGRPVGVNLIVADNQQGEHLGGRLISEASVTRVIEQGLQLINLYIRPQMGGSFKQMVEAATMIQQISDNRVLLIGVPTFSKPAPRTGAGIANYQAEIQALMEAGCDGIGLPMPGSKQGWNSDIASQLVDTIHTHGGLAWLFITGSVEGAPQQMMTDLALMAKQIGADAYRLDEAGLSGMPLPENIHAFSLAIRGKRHTYRRMAASVRR